MISHEALAEYLLRIHSAKSLDTKVKMPLAAGVSAGAEPVDKPVSASVSLIAKSWVPVQCENCHSAGQNHPLSGVYPKKVADSVCLSCHTQERAPSWYNAEKKLDPAILQAKRALVQCPAGDL